MPELLVKVDDTTFEALVRQGPPPEDAARRLLERSVPQPSAWELLESGLGAQGAGQNLSDTVDIALYGAR